MGCFWLGSNKVVPEPLQNGVQYEYTCVGTDHPSQNITMTDFMDRIQQHMETFLAHVIPEAKEEREQVIQELCVAPVSVTNTMPTIIFVSYNNQLVGVAQLDGVKGATKVVLHSLCAASGHGKKVLDIAYYVACANYYKDKGIFEVLSIHEKLEKFYKECGLDKHAKQVFTKALSQNPQPPYNTSNVEPQNFLITVPKKSGGGNRKYTMKKTGDKILLLGRWRNIYICNRAKYVKYQGSYERLSLLKKKKKH